MMVMIGLDRMDVMVHMRIRLENHIAIYVGAAAAAAVVVVVVAINDGER